MSGRIPTIAITMGDINGIGPEIIVKVLKRRELLQKAKYVIFGNLKAYTFYAEMLNSSIIPEVTISPEDITSKNYNVGIVELGYEDLPFEPGKLYPVNSSASVAWIREAVNWALRYELQAIVTAPITKEGLSKANIPYDGHTSLLADLTGTKNYRMTLYTKGKWIVHHTAHLPLIEAIGQIQLNSLVETIKISYGELKNFYATGLRMAVAGLNPHAGENGLFGREELDVIKPAIEECNKIGIPCSGPYSPDTVFRRLWLGEFDVVVAMYHDQGHIPLKLVAMDEGVNVTLGLPIIRTSVDHGTAFDIAGKGIANERSLMEAINLAIELSNKKRLLRE